MLLDGELYAVDARDAIEEDFGDGRDDSPTFVFGSAGDEGVEQNRDRWRLIGLR